MFYARLCAVSLSLAFAGQAAAGTNSWSVTGPVGAPIYAIEVSRANRQNVLASIPRGIARSNDGGETWQVSTTNLLNGPQSIDFDPTDATHIIASDGYLYFSDDSGQTFNLIAGPRVENDAWRAAYAADGTLYTLHQNGRLFKGNFPFGTWTNITGPWGTSVTPELLSTDPTDANRVYVVIRGLGVYRSDNAGVSFTGPLTTGFAPVADVGVYELKVDPSNPTRVLAATTHGIHVSTNRGATWTIVDTTPTFSIDFDPVDAGQVIAVRTYGAVMRSTDYGMNWTDRGADLRTQGSPRARYTAPNAGTRLVISSEHGPAVSTDEGVTFSFHNSALRGATPTRIVKADDSRVFVSMTAGLGSIFQRTLPDYTALDPAAFNSAITGVRNVGALDVFAGDSQVLMAVNIGNQLVRTTDRGAHWSVPHPQFTSGGADYITDVRFAPNTASVGYVGRIASGLWKTTNSGTTYVQLTNSPSHIGVIGVSPLNPSIVYVGASMSENDIASGLYRSSDGGATWVAQIPPGGNTVFNSIFFDPLNVDVVYAAGFGGMYKTANGGASWSPMDFGAPYGTAVNGSAMLIDPLYPDTMVMVSTPNYPGFLRTVDGGAHWAETRLDVPGNEYVMQYAVMPTPGQIVAGSTNIGVVEYTIAPDLEVTLEFPPGGVPVPTSTTQTFGFVVKNNGPHAASPSDLVITVPDWLAPAVPGACTFSAPTMHCSVPALQVGSQQAFRIDFQVSATPGASNFLAEIQAHEPDSNSSNDRHATGNLSSEELADLDVTLTASAAFTEKGGTLSLQAAAVNNGPSPSNNTSLVWQIPNLFSVKKVTSSRGTCTSTATQVSCQFGTMAVGAAANVSVDLTGAALGTGYVSVNLAGAGRDPDNFQHSAQVLLDVRPVSDISISLAESADPVTLGAPLQYVATVRNNGGDPTTVVVNLAISGATVSAVVPSSGTCTNDATSVRCTMSPTGTETITVDLGTTAAGIVTGGANATVALGRDPDTSNNSATIGTTVRLVGDVSVEIADSLDPAPVGPTFNYTATVRNAGPFAGAVNVAIPITGANLVSATTPGGTCTTSNATANCTITSLASGASTTITVTVFSPIPANASATATATFAGFDPDSSNNSATANTVVRAVADIGVTIAESADPATAGGVLSYLVTLTSAGPSPGNVHLSVPVTGSAVTGATPSQQGICSIAAGTVTCDFAPMDFSPSTVSIVVNSATAGTTTATATVTYSGTDPVSTNDTATASTTVVARASSSSSSSSGGGGGGGGRFDWLALGLLGVAAWRRCYSANRR